MRSDGSESRLNFDDATASQYDRAGTQTLIDKFCNTGAILIYVDSDANITGPCAQTWPGNNDHFHVRYPLP